MSCCSSVWLKALLTRLHSISLLTMGENGCSLSPELLLFPLGLVLMVVSSSSEPESRAGSLDMRLERFMDRVLFLGLEPVRHKNRVREVTLQPMPCCL